MKKYSHVLRLFLFFTCFISFSAISESEFLSTYGFTCRLENYSRSYREISSYTVCLHRFIPEGDSIGTVVYSHGFLDSTGISRNVIEYLLTRGYEVYSIDLPGHGFSSGARAEIDDFHTFGDLLNLIVETTEFRKDLPLIVMGHSMGSSVIMDFLFRYTSPFDKAVLVCPLWRSTYWQISKLAYILTRPMMDRLPRRFGGSSSDRAYNHFVRYEDPMKIKDVPLSWFAQLQKWQETLTGLEPVDKSVYLMTAGHDTVVDNRYNSRLIGDKFTVAGSYVLQGSRHSIFNETEALRLKAFRVLDIWLAD